MIRSHLSNILTHLESERISMAKGDYLFYQGDQVANFHYIETGKIILTRNTIEGGQALIYMALPGETFAEASLFSDEYHCSAVANSESRILS